MFGRLVHIDWPSRNFAGAPATAAGSASRPAGAAAAEVSPSWSMWFSLGPESEHVVARRTQTERDEGRQASALSSRGPAHALGPNQGNLRDFSVYVFFELSLRCYETNARRTWVMAYRSRGHRHPRTHTRPRARPTPAVRKGSDSLGRRQTRYLALHVRERREK